MAIARVLERIARSKSVLFQLLKPNSLLQMSSVVTVSNEFNIEKIFAVREVSAAVLNISGRQRMLSQRSALFALRLTLATSTQNRESLQKKLCETLDLMERSHESLINGDLTLNLSGALSPAISKIYYEAPYQLNSRVRDFLEAGRKLARIPADALNCNNPYLQHLLHTSEGDLLEALDAAVLQYQKEKEQQEKAIDLYQAKLYKDTCTAMAVAQARSQALSDTITKLQQTQIQLIQAEKLSGLGQLVAGVAHEINNPLGFISGNIQYAKMYVSDLIEVLELYQHHYPDPHPEIKDFSQSVELDYTLVDLPKLLDTMNLGVERIKEVVLSLRNFSRLDEVKPSLIDLHECIESTMTILRYRFKSDAPSSPINIVKEYTALPKIDCYPGQINQVLINLVGNAIDALEGVSENPTIVIRTKPMATDPGWVEIQIEDNGSGVSEELQQNLFKPFFTTKSVGKGTGLGLSISHQIIVERHGGNLIYRSRPGGGSEFTIQLPLRQ
ncbi:ATP-binding protein [Oscillatoria sp. FACHB-1406]|uniref:ATP-binding protein n=1 Tax=Oscillatoria sp. FACHB-1406 TaxID=2692846 RepID=UPI001686D8CA|nr:ATP-binding protein [Oscillatoria sp. FACHB-1406]MBD2579097.1 type IV pili methyl-accepting chemotaxis transducer N-terminal domain-containing protein [Oscillatoria sp. FACHB-1406]